MARTPRQPKPKFCPWVIVRDTREQAPFAFQNVDENFDVIHVVDKALDTGDYSIAGFENRITIERKSVSDFYQSIGADRERFEREAERLAKMEFAAIVIEGNWKDIWDERPSTIQMSAKSATHTILSWQVRYGIHFHLSEHRRHAEIATFHLLRHFWKQEQERIKAEKEREADEKKKAVLEELLLF